jgi:hypothetical protein
VIAAYILIQTEAGKAGIVAAAFRGAGASETASAAGPYDVTARAGRGISTSWPSW